MADTSILQLAGAGGFGAVVGWQLYYVNRYRTDAVGITDVAALVAAIGGAAVLALFPAESDLFAAYGIGLFLGFFTYFAILVTLVTRSNGTFTAAWFLDGRRRRPTADEVGGDESGRAMEAGQRRGVGR